MNDLGPLPDRPANDAPSGDAASATAWTTDAAAADKYDQMLALADLFDSSGNDLRARARLGTEILRDDDVAASAELSPSTWAEAEEDVLAATTARTAC